MTPNPFNCPPCSITHTVTADGNMKWAFRSRLNRARDSKLQMWTGPFS